MSTPDTIVRVMLDGVPHGTKPDGDETAAITGRLKGSGPCELTLEQLMDRISRGHTWCPACFGPCRGGERFGYSEFLGMRLFALDLDHADGDERAPAPDPLATVDALAELGVAVAFWYPTFSATEADPRHRVVVDAGRELDKEDAGLFAKWLISVVPGADTQCKNTNRLYHGTDQRCCYVGNEASTDVGDVVREQRDFERAKAATEAAARSARSQKAASFGGDHSDLADALNAIPCDATDHEVWVKLGTALKASGIEFDVFDAWSATDTREGQYRGERETRRQWNSFDPNSGPTSGYVVEVAKSHGWTPEGRDASGDADRGEAGAGATGGGAKAWFGVNDATLGEQFANRYRRVLRYVVEEDCYYYYDGTCWRPDTKNMVHAVKLAKVFVRDLMERCDPTWDEETRKKRCKAFKPYLNHTRRVGLVRDAMGELCASRQDFDRDRNALNLRNGTYHFDTGEFAPHDPADMCTKVAGADFVPNERCGDWERLVKESFEGDEDAMRYMQQQMGLALVGDTSQERMHMLLGVVRSGKSTTLNTVREVFGDYAINISPSTITKQQRSSQNASGDLARLEGVRFATVPEPGRGMQLSAEVVKMLTGNDAITCRALYRGERDVKPMASIWVATNHPPLIDDPTVVDSDRIVVIPFDHHVPRDKRDAGLKWRLLSDKGRAGVLNWLFDGLRDWKSKNRIRGIPKELAEATTEVLGAPDLVAQFMAEALVAEGGATMKGAECFGLYRDWCEQGGYTPDGKHEFFDALRRKGLLRRVRKVRNVVVGYRQA